MSPFLVIVATGNDRFTGLESNGSIPVSGKKAPQFSDDPRMVLKARRTGIRARSFVSAQP